MINKNPEWLTWRETGCWRFSPKLISEFRIGLLAFDMTEFIGILKIVL